MAPLLDASVRIATARISRGQRPCLCTHSSPCPALLLPALPCSEPHTPGPCDSQPAPRAPPPTPGPHCAHCSYPGPDSRRTPGPASPRPQIWPRPGTCVSASAVPPTLGVQGPEGPAAHWSGPAGAGPPGAGSATAAAPARGAADAAAAGAPTLAPAGPRPLSSGPAASSSPGPSPLLSAGPARAVAGPDEVPQGAGASAEGRAPGWGQGRARPGARRAPSPLPGPACCSRR